VGEGLAVLVAVGECFGVRVAECLGVPVAVGDCFGVPVAVGDCFGVPVADGDCSGVRVADGVALSESLCVLVLVADVLVADADGPAYDVLLVGVGVFVGSVGDFVRVFVGVCDGVAAELDVSVLVGAGVGSDGVVSELLAPDGDGLADWLALALSDFVGDGLVVASVGVLAVGVGVLAVEVGVLVGVVGVDVGVVGAAVGVDGAAVGVGEVEVGDGDGLGGEADSCSGSHDLPLDVVAALAAAVFAATVRLTPEVAVSRTPPAIRVTVAGRACAKRMKRPYPVLFVAAMERLVHYGLAS
jgi:hypothetical protein